MINVIITESTRPDCGCPPLTYYSAGGVFLALTQKGLKVSWVDVKFDEKGSIPPASNENIADICCYAVFFGNKTSAFDHMKEMRSAKKPPRSIIAFGPFAAAFPDEILSRGLADIVVFADPEFVIPMILKSGCEISSLSMIPNLAYIQNEKIISTIKHSFENLDEIPFIAPHLYVQGEQPAYIMTARGCQYHCVFCERNAIWGGGVRQRSVENVLKEIEYLVEIMKVRKIEFLDEDLAADPQYVIALCKGLSRIKGEFDWVCSACVNSVNEKLLLLMGHSRCQKVYYGVESASSNVLRQIGKNYGPREILNAVRWTKGAGIKAEIMITIGNPGETGIDQKLTLSVLKEIENDAKIISNRVTILPGTALYRKGLREGWFTEKSFFEDEGLIFYDEQGQAPRNQN